MRTAIWFASGWIAARHVDPWLEKLGRALAAVYRRRAGEARR